MSDVDYHTVPWRRDCGFNPGHDDGMIPLSEVYARRMTALVCREYLDPDYLIPKPAADRDRRNEPPFARRVPEQEAVTARPALRAPTAP